MTDYWLRSQHLNFYNPTSMTLKEGIDAFVTAKKCNEKLLEDFNSGSIMFAKNPKGSSNFERLKIACYCFEI